jgi:hypothetical protein
MSWTHGTLDLRERNTLCTLLGMQRIIGPHTGENQAELVWNILQEYEIERKVSSSSIQVI